MISTTLRKWRGIKGLPGGTTLQVQELIPTFLRLMIIHMDHGLLKYPKGVDQVVAHYIFL